jgi:hypothetical protein
MWVWLRPTVVKVWVGPRLMWAWPRPTADEVWGGARANVGVATANYSHGLGGA